MKEIIIKTTNELEKELEKWCIGWNENLNIGGTIYNITAREFDYLVKNEEESFIIDSDYFYDAINYYFGWLDIDNEN